MSHLELSREAVPKATPGSTKDTRCSFEVTNWISRELITSRNYFLSNASLKKKFPSKAGLAFSYTWNGVSVPLDPGMDTSVFLFGRSSLAPRLDFQGRPKTKSSIKRAHSCDKLLTFLSSDSCKRSRNQRPLLWNAPTSHWTRTQKD